MPSPALVALLTEAQFTREILGAGATQIRKANYATKGIYFQAFTSLSTGIERIGKLCLALDFCADHGGKFPDSKYMKHEIGHRISLIYDKSKVTIANRSLPMAFWRHLDDPIHLAILEVLSEFANGDRYSNIPGENLPIGDCRYQDPEGDGWRIDNPPPGTTPNPLRNLSGGNQAWLQELVVHLREPGGCVIG